MLRNFVKEQDPAVRPVTVIPSIPEVRARVRDLELYSLAGAWIGTEKGIITGALYGPFGACTRVAAGLSGRYWAVDGDSLQCWPDREFDPDTLPLDLL